MEYEDTMTMPETTQGLFEGGAGQTAVQVVLLLESAEKWADWIWMFLLTKGWTVAQLLLGILLVVFAAVRFAQHRGLKTRHDHHQRIIDEHKQKCKRQ